MPGLFSPPIEPPPFLSTPPHSLPPPRAPLLPQQLDFVAQGLVDRHGERAAPSQARARSRHLPSGERPTLSMPVAAVTRERPFHSS